MKLDKQKILLELMYDFIEKILTPREYEIFLLSKNMRPRHIAKKLGIKARTVTNIKVNIRKKIEKHEMWLVEKKLLRGA
ncbi:MAG: LuxR C-terminal-related transcriptional regulator [Fusobacteriaceae bacterium]